MNRARDWPEGLISPALKGHRYWTLRRSAARTNISVLCVNIIIISKKNHKTVFKEITPTQKSDFLKTHYSDKADDGK